jgi:hypothetical protein
MANRLADVKFSCGAGSIVKIHFRSGLRTTFIQLRCFSGSAIATITKLISDPSPSSTSWIFQSHCLRSLCEIIDATHRIEVSGLNDLSHFIHTHILMSIVKYAENDFPLLRSKIRALYPVHRASLGTLLRHLLRVSSHSNKNAMTVEALATRFSYTVLRTGNAVLQGGVDVKARYYNLCKIKKH